MDKPGCHGIALFGLGRIGLEHLKNMVNHSAVSLLWVVEQDVLRANDVLLKYGQNNTRVVSPKEDHLVFADGRVVGIAVCTPSYTHAEIVLKALKAGKAIFCEKPVAPSLEDVVQLYSEAAKLNVPLFCGFNRRYDPQLKKIHDLVQEGGVGKIHVVKTCSRDPAGLTATAEYYKKYGGYPFDSGVHDIDVVCWILKEHPLSIYASGHAHTREYGDMGDVDTMAIILRFPSGAMGVIEMSRNSQYGFDQRVEVFGEKGMIASENPRKVQTVSLLADGVHMDGLSTNFMDRYAESYVNELEHFVAVLDGRSEVEVRSEEVVMVSQIAKACHESIKSGQMVKLTWT